MRRLLPLALALSGCECRGHFSSAPPEPATVVPAARCILACVERTLASREDVDGAAVDRLAVLCAAALEGRRCCVTVDYGNGFVRPCDEVPDSRKPR